MSAKFDVAVVGATGAVGETMLEILAERNFPVNNVYPLASARSAGKKIPFGDTYLTVEDLSTFDFSKAQIGLFSAGASISDKYAPLAAAAGCVVIDNTSRFRYEDEIPLVVPEVNPDAIADYTRHNIIANAKHNTTARRRQLFMVNQLKTSHLLFTVTIIFCYFFCQVCCFY